MPTAERIRAVVARCGELVSRGDADAIAQLYAPDATVEDPVGRSAETMGRE
jgi:steroid delta-isomerase